ASAQVKSAILLAGLNASGETEIEEPGLSRDHTERMLRDFGVKLDTENNRVRLQGHQPLRGRMVHVPGDFSSAAFFIAAATLVPDSAIALSNVGLNPTRTGLLDALYSMSPGHIEVIPETADLAEESGTIRVQSCPLKSTSVGEELVVRMIDEFPIFAALASLAKGKTTIRNASELRVKESDRIAVMAQQLRKMGVEVQEFPDGMDVVGSEGLHAATVESHGDHRIAMSLAVAALRSSGETVIENTDCIATSFPGFVDLMRELGADIEEQECRT
ncbi:MAG TPA: 3-phosphoshikimate 1-carboxyvinyltransferase, partial [bacterium]|nr:3-phosphoshikimate 1-carboxyvinyltransferase [bacterium]